MDLVCGGYFLVKRGPYRIASGSAPRGTHVTLSAEHIDFYPDTWTISWVHTDDDLRTEIAEALDIPASILPTLIEKLTSLFNEDVFRWPNVIPSVDAARRLAALLPPTPGWLLIGFAVAPDEVDGLLKRFAPPAQRPGFAPTGAGGIYKTLDERKPLEPGFTELGFDVLNLDHGQVMHNHLSCGLKLVGAYEGELNADGLLPTWAAAQTAARVLTGNPAIGTPRTMTAVRVVSYGL